jgi:hypothetical protein
MSLKSLWRKIAFAGVLGQRVTYSTIVSLAVSKSSQMRKQKLMKQETRSQTLKSRSSSNDGILRGLTDDQIDQLVADHWREIKGLLQEMKRRRKKIVSNTDKPTLGA